MLNDDKYFLAFPHNNVKYELTWLGTAKKSLHIENSYVINAYFRKVEYSEDSRIDPEIHQTSKESTPRNFSVDLPVVLSTILRLGSIWKNGKIVGKSNTEKVLIRRVKFNKTETPLLKATATYESGKYFIPPFFHALNDNAWKTYILTFSEKNDFKSKMYVLPSAEIWRFDYNNSTNLNEALLVGDWTDTVYGLYNPNKSYYSSKDNTHYIHLRQKIRNLDAPLVARFYFSKYASSCLNEFSNRFREDMIRFGEAGISCYPPFIEEVDLVVHGKTLKTKDREIFLIYWIESSSSPFPFKKLEYSRDNSGDKGKTETEELKKYQRFQKAKLRNDEDSPKNENTDKPISTSKERSRKIETLWEEYNSTRFPSLRETIISKNEKEIQTHFGGRPFSEIDAPDAFSMQGGGYGVDDLTPFGIAETLCIFDESLKSRQRKDSLPVNLETMRQVIDILQEKPGIFVESIRLYPYSTPNTEDSSYIQGNKAWCFINGRSRNVRRQILVKRVKLDGNSIYLLELEKRPPHRDGREREKFATLLIWEKTFLDLTIEELEHLVSSCTSREGWIDEEEMKDLKRKRLFHTSHKVEEFADKIFKEIRGFIVTSEGETIKNLAEDKRSEIITLSEVA